MGRSLRLVLSASRCLVRFFSCASSSLRAASHSSRVAILGRLIPASLPAIAVAWACLPIRRPGEPELIGDAGQSPTTNQRQRHAALKASRRPPRPPPPPWPPP